MTSKLLRIVPMILSLSIPALAVDPAPATPPADTHHETKEAKDAKKKKVEEKKDEKSEKKAEEKK